MDEVDQLRILAEKGAPGAKPVGIKKPTAKVKVKKPKVPHPPTVTATPAAVKPKKAKPGIKLKKKKKKKKVKPPSDPVHSQAVDTVKKKRWYHFFEKDAVDQLRNVKR